MKELPKQSQIYFDTQLGTKANICPRNTLLQLLQLPLLYECGERTTSKSSM